ncbi:hypothetical protein [Caballeronia sp. BR00000012568055]|uniref:hypothetical protein n=1 Tax=Caballeronia sp. BR00000012568055 TaxID=2918761 RepID=UPI0023F84966|nr:hypothetical protein [Caballeronia sp. BR00000012568055]
MRNFKRPYRLISRRSCWRLVQLYHQGLAEGKWTTQLGALNALGVSQGDLSMAMQLHQLPEKILDLFEDHVDISSHTVRIIRHTIRRDGLNTVLGRIDRSGASGAKHSKRTVLSIVKGQALESKKMLRWSGEDPAKIMSRTLVLPKNISDRYHLGVTQGEWNSFSACAQALGISRRNISDAVAIRELPDSIRHLFRERDLTFSVGRKLLTLKRELGLDELLLRARYKDSMYDVGGRTADNILSEINEENIRPLSAFRRIQIKKGRGPNRLVIECKDPKLLLRYRREIEMAISKVLKKRVTDEEFVELMRGMSSTQRAATSLANLLPSTFRPRSS